VEVLTVREETRDKLSRSVGEDMWRRY